MNKGDTWIKKKHVNLPVLNAMQDKGGQWGDITAPRIICQIHLPHFQFQRALAPMKYQHLRQGSYPTNVSNYDFIKILQNWTTDAHEIIWDTHYLQNLVCRFDQPIRFMEIVKAKGLKEKTTRNKINKVPGQSQVECRTNINL